MKFIFTLPVFFFILSCGTARYNAAGINGTYGAADTLITQSLFSDKNASISEENIRLLLDGDYELPQQLRVAIVRLENNSSRPNRHYFLNDEDFLKTQQSYLDTFTAKLRQSPRVKRVAVIPEIVVSKSPSFTQLREAAVRLQSDIVIVYSIASDIYSRYKPFSNPDLKAFATTQLILLDVRTGMVPFSTIVTKDQLSKKIKSELDHSQASARVQHEAVLLTIDECSTQLLDFLKKD